MTKRFANTADAARFAALLNEQGLWPSVTGCTVTASTKLKYDKHAWQKALKRFEGQNVIRRAAESRSMMETESLL